MAPTRDLLSPKQVAKAIGVSESSLKRWCDRGLIPTVRTAGGHRRLPMSGILKFLQSSGQRLVNPEELGLPPGLGTRTDKVDDAIASLRLALIANDEDVCRRILYDAYLSGQRLPLLCDDLIRPVFEDLGEQWACGDIEIYQERSACEIVQRLLNELRVAWSSVDRTQPLAMGATLSGDRYALPSQMCELVLRERGWRSFALGTDLPISTLQAAIRQHRPRLFWLSVSHLADVDQFLEEYPGLYNVAQQHRVALVVGGRALGTELRSKIHFSTYCERMKDLDAFSEMLLSVSGTAHLPRSAGQISDQMDRDLDTREDETD